MPACSQPHGELQQEWLPLLSTRLLLECSSPVRAQNPDLLDALPQSCPPSVMHLVDIAQLHWARQVPDAMSAASRGVGNSAAQGQHGRHAPQSLVFITLGHSPIAFLSLGEGFTGKVVHACYMQMTSVSTTPLSEQKKPWVSVYGLFPSHSSPVLDNRAQHSH